MSDDHDFNPNPIFNYQLWAKRQHKNLLLMPTPRQTDHSDREILRSWSVSQRRGKFLVQRLGRTTLRTSRRRTRNSRRFNWPSPLLSSWPNFHSMTLRSAVSVATPSTCATAVPVSKSWKQVKERNVQMFYNPDHNINIKRDARREQHKKKKKRNRAREQELTGHRSGR